MINRLPRRAAGLLLLLGALALGGQQLQAQAASFAYSASTLPFAGSPTAADGSGNVYVATWDNGGVVIKYTPSGQGYTQAATIASEQGTVWGVAVDASGDVFVASNGSPVHEYAYTASTGTYASASTPIGSIEAKALALDGSGNLYLIKTDRNLYKYTLSGGAYSQTGTEINDSSSSQAAALAVRSDGTVFATFESQSNLVEFTASGSSYSATVMASVDYNALAVGADGSLYVATGTAINKFAYSSGSYASSATTFYTTGGNYPVRSLAADPKGNLYYGADSSVDNGGKLQLGAVNLGTVAVGSTGTTTAELTFNVTTAGSFGAPVALTQGATGKDFAIKSTTCSGSITSTGTCTVDVSFTPLYPGQRLGAVQLMNAAGTAVLASAPVYGIGSGPQISFPSNTTASTVASGFSFLNGVAVDGNGDLFVVDTNSFSVKEIVAVNGVIPNSPTVKTVLKDGSYNPESVAVDGSGNVFVADSRSGQSGLGVVKEIVAVNGVIPSSPTVKTVASGFTDPDDVAVDASGNLFVADYSTGKVSEIVAVNGAVSSSSTVKSVGSGFSTPNGVAVDASGNVFVADYINKAVYEIVAVNGAVSSASTVNTVGSNFRNPTDVAVDASGNLFVANFNNGTVEEIVAVNGEVSSDSTVRTVSSGSIYPYAITVDGSGNLFAADGLHNAVYELPLATPPSLSFATTSAGATSAAQTVTVTNNGNADLSFAGLSISNGFTLGSATTCSATGTLAEGESCTLAVEFTPAATQSGTITGTITLTDNTLNAASPSYATQTINLSGAAVEIVVTPASSTLAAGTVGTAYSQQFGVSSETGATSTSYTYSVYSGTLPAGLTLTTAGVLGGTPTAADTYGFTIAATDSNSYYGTQSYSLGVAQGTPSITWATPTAIVAGTTLSNVLDPVAYTNAAHTTQLSGGSYSYTATPSGSNTATSVTSSTVLANGTYTLTASYTPADTTDYASGAQASVSLTVYGSDYTWTDSGTTTTQTVIPGQAANYTFAIAPIYSSYGGTISFTASGLPTGATASFTPSSIAASAGAQTVTLTVQTAAATARAEKPGLGGKLALALLLLPLLGFGRVRRQARRWLCLVVLLSGLAAASMLGGCGSGYFSQSQKNYTVKITAAGGGYSHDTYVTLNLQ